MPRRPDQPRAPIIAIVMCGFVLAGCAVPDPAAPPKQDEKPPVFVPLNTQQLRLNLQPGTGWMILAYELPASTARESNGLYEQGIDMMLEPSPEDEPFIAVLSIEDGRFSSIERISPPGGFLVAQSAPKTVDAVLLVMVTNLSQPTTLSIARNLKSASSIEHVNATASGQDGTYSQYHEAGATIAHHDFDIEDSRADVGGQRGPGTLSLGTRHHLSRIGLQLLTMSLSGSAERAANWELASTVDHNTTRIHGDTIGDVGASIRANGIWIGSALDACMKLESRSPRLGILDLDVVTVAWDPGQIGLNARGTLQLQGGGSVDTSKVLDAPACQTGGSGQVVGSTFSR